MTLSPGETHAPLVIARRDTSLGARVVREVSLRYAHGADPALDRPAAVRAASGLARVTTPVGDRLAVVQDDANFIALVDPATGLADAITLAAGPGGRRLFDVGRGNKLDKTDLESCLVLDDPERPGAPMLVAFGSGALAVRERIVIVQGLDGGFQDVTVHEIDASRLYDLLRRRPEFAGVELNVEEAVLVQGADGAVVRLCSRGNGLGAERSADAATPGTTGGTSATCDLDAAAFVAYLLDPTTAPVPAPTHIVRYDLGTIDGQPLGFTDATPWGDGRMLYTAAAEHSVNVLEDGPVAGSVLGVVGASGEGRWAPLTEASGAPFRRKAEGVARADVAGRVWIVLDIDDPTQPAVLCEVALEGDWGALLAPGAHPEIHARPDFS